MKRFIEGTDRGQSTLFPECLEDWIDGNNTIRSDIQRESIRKRRKTSQG
jgi:hypothetical protein